MASPSEITMMRELSAAGDRERTGAFDVEWEGARASLFFIFGHANHVELERADGRRLVGADALSAIASELPEDFHVSPWRRAMVTDDTLRLTAEELMFMFRRDPAKASGRKQQKPESADEERSGLAFPPGAADRRDADAIPEVEAAAGSPEPAEAPPDDVVADEAAPAASLPFGLADFPPLPHGPAMFSDSAGNVEGLDEAIPHLPDSLILLTSEEARGAVLVGAGAVTDAVWVDAESGRAGDDAAAAVLSSRDGVIAAYRVTDARLLAAIPTLWRSGRPCAAVPAGWVDPEAFVADAGARDLSVGLLTTGGETPGVALFQDGALVAAYTAAAPAPSTDPAALAALLSAPGARVTLIGAPAAEAGGDPEIGGTTFPLILIPAAEAAPAEVEDEITAIETVEFVESGRSHEVAVFSLADLGDTAVAEADSVAAIEAAIAELEAIEDLEEAVTEMEAVAELEEAVAEMEAAAELEEAVAEMEAAAELEEAVAEMEALAELEEAPSGLEAPAAEPEAAAQPAVTEEPAADATIVSAAPEPPEFVPARVDVDIDALRAELVGIAEVWLGDADAGPVAAAIHAARPGVDDFVAAIQAIASMEIPGHEHAVVRAMAREMHFRAAEVLCGV